MLSTNVTLSVPLPITESVSIIGAFAMVIQFVYRFMKCNMNHLVELQFIPSQKACLLILQLRYLKTAPSHTHTHTHVIAVPAYSLYDILTFAIIFSTIMFSLTANCCLVQLHKEAT